ncbi:MAG: tRNA uridine-5-carboxymethylaminomethyl(34) synthesis GTPase MnmE [Alphaproteobacteria bacterium]|nr:tRNA uridine-5-carboxymethylaminomethyl(34) synthesis GTPase MnmE [Alphaproteobacteria bacterium]
MNDTIFALSSGHGKAGVAVIRVSGTDLRGLFGRIISNKDQIKPRHAYLADLVDVEGDIIDRAIAIYFQAPNSFTGEDVIEFHVHGSSAVIEKLFETLRTYGARIACPGEFTRRAFDNGKMDLVEADGLVALLDARTDRQRVQALKSMAGGDSAIYENWRLQMIEIAAYSAAILDYPADELPGDISESLLTRTRALHDEINTALSRSASVRAIRSGFNIAIVGETNAGKSSLFNRLVGESRAIVSDIPGTTRDVVSAEIDIDGYLVRLADTAGLRETTDTIEKIGIEKTNQEIENADLVILICSPDGEGHDYARRNRSNAIIVHNKSDLNKVKDKEGISTSALTGEGISELLESIKAEVHSRLDSAESDVAVNARTKALLIDAVKELENAINIGAEQNQDLFAEHVHRAADSIGRVLGIIGADEIADAVFGQLCLGK